MAGTVLRAVSAYFILTQPPKDSTSIVSILQMRKLEHRTGELIRERELEVGWGSEFTSHQLCGLEQTTTPFLSLVPPLSNEGRARTAAEPGMEGLQRC